MEIVFYMFFELNEIQIIIVMYSVETQCHSVGFLASVKYHILFFPTRIIHHGRNSKEYPALALMCHRSLATQVTVPIILLYLT